MARVWLLPCRPSPDRRSGYRLHRRGRYRPCAAWISSRAKPGISFPVCFGLLFPYGWENVDFCSYGKRYPASCGGWTISGLRRTISCLRQDDILPLVGLQGQDIVTHLPGSIVSQGLGEYMLLIHRKRYPASCGGWTISGLRRTISCLRQDDILPLVGPQGSTHLPWSLINCTRCCTASSCGIFMTTGVWPT